MISILLVTEGTPGALLATLQSLEASIDESIEYELVVVDNGNSDTIADIVRSCADDPRVWLVRQENRGYAGGVAAAAAVARGFADHPDAGDVLVPVALGNEASWRALRRAGFTWYAEGELTPDNPADPPEHVVHRFTRLQG